LFVAVCIERGVEAIRRATEMASGTRGASVLAGLLAALAAAGCGIQPQAVPGAAEPALSLSPVASTTPSVPATPTTPTSSPADPPTSPSVPRLPDGYQNEEVLGTTSADRPIGWSINAQPTYTDYRDPTGHLLLRFGTFTNPDQTPDSAVRELAASTRQNYADYSLIRLTGPTNRTASGLVVGSYSEWEFTFDKDGESRQVIVRGVGGRTSSGKTQVAVNFVYYSAPVDEFADNEPVYRRAVDSIKYVITQ
jgi:hypothetical protein